MNMKKVISAVLVVLILLSLTACGGKTVDSAKVGYPGTWKLDHVVNGGAEFTRSELEALDTSVSQFRIVLKEGGKACMTDGKSGQILDWRETEGGILLSNVELKMEQGLLCVKISEEEIWYFGKVSDSQLIEKTPETQEPLPETEVSENQEPEGTEFDSKAPFGEPEALKPAAETDAELVDGMRPEFKEAMDAYEAFYDEYCDFMVSYQKNPTDLKLVTQYGQLMTKMVEVNEAFEKWDESELNNEELKYYLEVSSRVMQKLVDAAG